MGYRGDINGLRAVAVLAVVLFHFDIPPFRGGFIGVDVFFVISGYLMTEILAGRGAGLLSFYFARAKRIMPALAGLCFILLALGWLALPPGDYQMLGKHAATSVSFLSNIVYWREAGYFDPGAHEKWLLHTWSLSVEWQFYLIYPLLLRAAGQRRIRIAIPALAMASFVLCVWMSSRHPEAAFYLLPTRMWELLAGGCVYLFPARAPRRVLWLGLALIAVSAVAFRSGGWPGWHAGVPVFGTALVIAANQKTRLLENKASAWLGRTSYSIYLWHWPVVVGFGYLGLTGAWVALGIGLSFVLGWLSFRFVEQPFRTMRPSAPAFARLAAGALPVLLGGCVVFFAHGVKARVSEEVLAAEHDRQRNAFHQKCLLTSGVNSPQCVLGSGVHAILIGDSHSDAVASALVAAKDGVLFLGYQNCIPIPDVIVHSQYAGYNCGKYVQQIFDQLSDHYVGVPIYVVARTNAYFVDEFTGEPVTPLPHFAQTESAITPAYLAEVEQRYVAGICQLTRSHTVYITLPLPGYPRRVPEALARAEMLGLSPNLTISLADYRRRNAIAFRLIRAAERQCGAHVVDPADRLCPRGVCTAVRDGHALYYDGTHLNNRGASLLIPLFK